MAKYKVLKVFRGKDERVTFSVGDVAEFTDERAKEIINNLGAGYIEVVVSEENDTSGATKPNDKSTVAEIKQFLDENHIEYDDKAKKDELLALIK
ncbi:hypothetical protein ACUIJP_04570 [Leuconostoc pseudomesenteroides]|uniref:hypothetical protein n=1 Tax=Leuconostoc pseudomesenteroides TaxID=33968 RepID=UPI00403DF0FF